MRVAVFVFILMAAVMDEVKIRHKIKTPMNFEAALGIPKRSFK